VIGRTSDPSRQIRVGLATAMFCGLFFVAVSPTLWAGPMVAWHTFGTQKESAAVTLATGLLTVSLALMVAMVACSFIGILGSALWRIVRGVGRELLVSVVAVVASSAYLTVAVHVALHYVIARGGIDWLQPGAALKQLAGASWSVIDNVENAVLSRGSGTGGLVLALSPLAFFAFCIAVASLARRTKFSPQTSRIGRFTIVVMVVMALVFLASYLLWTFAVGDATSLPFAGKSFPFLEFGIIGFAAMGCAACVAPHRWRTMPGA
jgi:hypothetical protein